MAIINIAAGTTLKIDGSKVQVDLESPIFGTYLPEEEKKQKTYQLKLSCPTCKRIFRGTKKSLKAGPLICGAFSHAESPAIFVEVDGETTD